MNPPKSTANRSRVIVAKMSLVFQTKRMPAKTFSKDMVSMGSDWGLFLMKAMPSRENIRRSITHAKAATVLLSQSTIKPPKAGPVIEAM